MKVIKSVHRTLILLGVMLGLTMSAPLMAADTSQFKLDMILAKRGDADAQYYVANAYEEGRGVGKDMKQAFDWYAKAADQNHYGAQYKLGMLYENGEGVEKDIKKAFEWYKKSAENGSTLAKERLNKAAFAKSEQVMKKRIAAMKEEQEKREKERKQEEERARQAAEREKAAQTKVVAAAPRSASIPDILDVVMKNNWNEGGQPADYLPSSSTSCLSASDTEVVCFSGEKQRIVNGLRVTYQTKATLTSFKSNGTFRVKYNYNAIQMDDAGTKGVAVDPHGLKLVEGWQEPQLTMNCQTTDRVNLYCSRGNVKVHYRR